jgi:hypothetical protein
MSVLHINNITNKEGTGGPTIAGITTVDSTGFMKVPVGDTRTRLVNDYENIVTDGLVLHLDAGRAESFGGDGTTWRDLSGQGNNGTLVNGVGFSAEDGGSLEFDGVNDYVQKSSATINLSAGVTMEMMFKSTDMNSRVQGFMQFNTHPNYINFYTPGNGFLRWETWVPVPTAGGSYTTPTTLSNNTWYHAVGTYTNGSSVLYINGNSVASASQTPGTYSSSYTGNIVIGAYAGYMSGNIAIAKLYNRALTAAEVRQNYNAVKGRYEKGGIGNPFSSPTEARILGYTSGDYYFKSGSMSSPQLLEFQRDYYENRGWVCVFRSPYRSTATTNRIDLNIPMGGLLVQRDALDLRAAVYWSTPITYNTVGGAGNNTADSGYSPRRVILGGSGGHGIFATNQTQCNWGSATGAIGAGWDGSTCGSFPNDLVWGTGRSDTATYENRSGIWSHWITWN